MKRTIGLFLALIMMFALSSCSMYSMSKEEISSFLDEYADIPEFSRYDTRLDTLFSRATKSKKFDSILSSYLEERSEANELKKYVNIVRILDYYNYENESIRTQFYNYLSRERSLLFQEGSNQLSDFLYILETVNNDLDKYETHYYLNIANFFPYEEMKTAIAANTDLVICETGNNGFYDTNDGEVKNESYWWSPLDKERMARGRVGFEKITTYNLFAGDFDVAMVENVFYGTNPGDYGNDVCADLYYKGKRISGDYTQINDFLSRCLTGKVFYWEDKSNDMFFIIDNNKITVYNRMHFASPLQLQYS